MPPFIENEQTDPTKTEPYYMKYCSTHNKHVICALAIAVAISASVALFTLITLVLENGLTYWN